MPMTLSLLFTYLKGFAAALLLLSITACPSVKNSDADDAHETQLEVSGIKTLVDEGDRVDLTVSFPKAMNPSSVGDALRVELSDGSRVTPEANWSQDHTALGLRLKDAAAVQETEITIEIDAEALTAAGTPLGEAYAETLEFHQILSPATLSFLLPRSLRGF